METSPEIPKQTREEAMAQTNELLSHASGWLVLATHTDEDGDLCGGAKFYIDNDVLVDTMIGTALNQPSFGRAVLKAALHISKLINLQTKEQKNNHIRTWTNF